MLDDLVGVIETLRSRIELHGTDLQKNEIRTRGTLIDPLLRALGWDVEDPNVVTLEYATGEGRPDYALLGAEGKPSAFIEAKRLNVSLLTHRSQMLNYSNEQGVRYAAITDGNHWELYTVFEPKKIEERLILDVTISTTPATQCALEFLLLWRPNLATLQPMSAAQPLFWPQTLETTVAAKLGGQPVAPTSVDTHEWPGLKDYTVKKNTKPTHVHFPDEALFAVNSWRSLLVQVAEWLIGRGELTQAKCPVLRANNPSGGCIVNIHPQHASGARFQSHAVLTNGLYLNVHFNAQNMVRECTRLLGALGHDPSSVSIAIT